MSPVVRTHLRRFERKSADEREPVPSMEDADAQMDAYIRLLEFNAAARVRQADELAVRVRDAERDSVILLERIRELRRQDRVNQALRNVGVAIQPSHWAHWTVRVPPLRAEAAAAVPPPPVIRRGTRRNRSEITVSEPERVRRSERIREFNRRISNGARR
jgi:hypothetical protein